MAKKSPRTPRSSSRTAAQRQRDLQQLDRDLVRLLHERARQTVQWSRQENWSPEQLLAATSLEAVLERLPQARQGPLDFAVVRAVLRELLAGTRSLLRPIKVAYLGPAFSYSHLAAVERFGTAVELVPVATIASVFEAVHRSQAHYGLVPIENSTDGRVADTLEMFARLPEKICGVVSLRIHHCLLGKCPQAEVRDVYSKPQALSQCRNWLARHVPLARTIEMASTAAAAHLAAEKPGAAAIASRQAGIQCGLDVIAARIEDNPHNTTRFAIIGDHPPTPSGHDRTSLMFEISHQPGALADTMLVFKRHALNLTWIESFPMPGSPHEYLFFVEFEGHEADAQVSRALEALHRKAERVELLGSYPETAPLD